MRRVNENSLKNLEKGKRFGQGQSINKNGRPKKLLRHLNSELKEKGYERVSASQVIEALEYLLNLPEDEIKAIAMDKDRPYFFRLMANTMGTKMGYYMINDTLDRVHGRATQPQVHSVVTSTSVTIKKK